MVEPEAVFILLSDRVSPPTPDSATNLHGASSLYFVIPERSRGDMRFRGPFRKCVSHYGLASRRKAR